jgi:hypothetical protein
MHGYNLADRLLQVTYQDCRDSDQNGKNQILHTADAQVLDTMPRLLQTCEIKCQTTLS